MHPEYSGYEKDRKAGKRDVMGGWELVAPYLQNKRTLDIGCSDGLYLERLTHDSIGIEQLTELAKIATDKGLHVFNSDLNDGLSKQTDNSFEAVLFSHVMEHLEQPIDVLREIHRILTPGGVLVLGLPTERNIFRNLLGHDYFLGTHILSFTVRNSEKLLELVGFSPEHTVYHLPKVRGRLSEAVHKAWNSIPLPGREWLSMGYWVIAYKHTQHTSE